MRTPACPPAIVGFVVLAAACGGSKPIAPSTRAPAPAPSQIRCTADPSAPTSLDVPEASAAVPMPGASGGTELLVLADSDHKGAALVVPIDPPGAPRATRLPLDAAASDDIEGAAYLRGLVYTLTSSGWARAHRRGAGDDFEPALGAWPIADVPIACKNPRASNCASNFEGLCLREPRAGGRVGFAAAKETSTLHPLAIDGDGRLRIDASTAPLVLALPHRTVSDCTYGPDGRLLVATNVLGLDRVYEVDEATGALEPIDVAGLLNDEAIAVDARGRLWIFEDDGKSPSATRRYDCAWPPARSPSPSLGFRGKMPSYALD